MFSAVITGLQGMEEGTERTVLAQKLLGGTAKELGALLNTSAEDTEAMRQRVHELGGVMSTEAVKSAAAYQDSLQDMQTAFGSLSRNLMSEFLPGIKSVMDGLTEIFSGDGGGMELISDGIDNMVSNLTEQLPQFLDVGVGIIESIIQAITDNLPRIMEAGVTVLLQIVEAIIQNLPAIAEAAVEVIVTLANGIAEALPELIPTVVDVILQIVDTLTDPENLGNLIDAALAIITALAGGLIKSIPVILERLPEIVQNIVKTLVENAPKLIEAALEIIVKLAEGLIKSIPTLVKAVPDLIEALVKGFTDGLGQITKIGENIVKGIWEGIKNLAAWFGQQVSSFFNGIVNDVKSALGIASPSKVFAGIGENMALGIGEGFDDAMDGVERRIDRRLDFSSVSIPFASGGGSASQAGAVAAGAAPQVTIEFGQLARVLEPTIRSETARRGASFVVA